MILAKLITELNYRVWSHLKTPGALEPAASIPVTNVHKIAKKNVSSIDEQLFSICAEE